MAILFCGLASNFVGEILMLGRFGGAIATYYRVAEVKATGGGLADLTLVPVVAVSVRDAEGFYSTRYEDA